MIGDREAIITALVAKLSAATFSQPVGPNSATTWAEVSRRVRIFSDVPRTQRPALFVSEHRESPSYQSGSMSQKNTLSVDLFIYTDASDKSAPGSIDLNIIMKALDAALAVEPSTNRQTLNGLVQHVRIEGDVLKDPGDIDGDGLLWVPVKIFVT